MIIEIKVTSLFRFQRTFTMILKSNTILLNPNLLILPSELLAEICENLSPQDLYSLSSVCKELRRFLWSKWFGG